MVSGTALQLQQTELLGAGLAWAVLWVSVVTLAGVLAVGLLWRRSHGSPALLAAFCLVPLLAAGAASWAQTELRAHARHAELWDDRAAPDWWVKGVVDDLPQPLRGPGGGIRFVLKVERAWPLGAGAQSNGVSPTNDAPTSSASASEAPVTGFPDATGPAHQPVPQPIPGKNWPSRIELGWWGSSAPAPEAFSAGQRWRLPVRLRPPHGLSNPHGSDRALWLWERGIGATGSVRTTRAAALGAQPWQDSPGAQRRQDPPGAQQLQAASGHWVARARQATRERLLQRVDDPALAGVLAALVSGDQAAIGPEEWQVFRATGVAHLMSISGLHITLFAWAARAWVGWAWRRSQRLCLWVPAVQAGWCLGLALAIGYAVFAGWGLPAQRTVFMLVVVAWLQGTGRDWPAPAVWLLALAAVVLGDPWALLQPGFWLSFVAVGLLMAGGPSRAVGEWSAPPDFAAATRLNGDAPDASARASTKRLVPAAKGVAAGLQRFGIAHWREQWRMSLGLAPLVLLWFHQWSAVGLLANALAIPWVTWVVTPLALLGLALEPLWLLAAWALAGLMAVLKPMADWSWSLWSWPQPALGWAVMALLGALVLALRVPLAWRALGLGLMLPALLALPERPAQGAFWLTALDVGQGSAVLVQTQHHALLFDAGPRWTPSSDAGQRVLLPHLRAQGVTLDTLVLSHPDQDHIGGAASVLAEQTPRQILGVLGKHVLAADPRFVRCQADSAQAHWVWDGVAFEVLHPGAPAHTKDRPTNTDSCVLRVQAKGASALLTGDIDQSVEQALGSLGQLAPTTLLVLPHHGSRSGSTEALLDATQPLWALVQAGFRNGYGHPHPEVLARLQQRNIRWRNSATCGAARFNSAQPDQLHCHRAAARRYWHPHLLGEPR